LIVRELMTRNVHWTAPDTSLTEAARRMRDNNIGCLPVGEHDAFVGMITETDIVRRATSRGIDPNTATVGQIMTSGICCCQEDDTPEEALQMMEGKNVHHLPVLNASSQVVGILSLSDLALNGPQELLLGASRLAFRRDAQATFNQMGVTLVIAARSASTDG
jgi:CBS domain-containing protein